MKSSNNLKIIAFSGLKGSGKTYAVEKICEKLNASNTQYQRMSFATRIRQMVISMFGERITPYLYDTVMKEAPIPWLYNVTARLLLQKLGTEFVRNTISDTYWIDCVEEQMLENPNIVYLFDDCRFENEASILRNYGAVNIRITSDDTVQTDHPSEQLFTMLDEETILHNSKDSKFEEELNILFEDKIKPRL